MPVEMRYQMRYRDLDCDNNARTHNRHPGVPGYGSSDVGRRQAALFVEHRNTVAPGIDDILDTLVHLCSSRFAVDTRHEQLVVVGVDMADGGDDG